MGSKQAGLKICSYGRPCRVRPSQRSECLPTTAGRNKGGTARHTRPVPFEDGVFLCEEHIMVLPANTTTTAARTLPSDAVYRAGISRAPARAYMRAMGLSDEDLAKPIIAVMSAWNEATPCNVHLNRLAAWAKQGVSAGGGTPRRFTTIAVT